MFRTLDANLRNGLVGPSDFYTAGVKKEKSDENSSSFVKFSADSQFCSLSSPFSARRVISKMPFPQTLEAKPKCIFFTDFDGAVHSLK